MHLPGLCSNLIAHVGPLQYRTFAKPMHVLALGIVCLVNMRDCFPLDMQEPHLRLLMWYVLYVVACTSWHHGINFFSPKAGVIANYLSTTNNLIAPATMKTFLLKE